MDSFWLAADSQISQQICGHLIFIEDVNWQINLRICG